MTRCGLVLAAGRSERFGPANKLLAPLQGKPLAAHVADAMRMVALDHRLVVVADPAVARLFEDFEIIAPDSDGQLPSQSKSLSLGARRAISHGSDRLLVTLADMPLVDADLLDKVLRATTDSQPASATDGTQIMPPACFPAGWFHRLTLAPGDRGAGHLLRDLPASARITAPGNMLTDVDVPADLDRLRMLSQPIR